MPGGEDTIGIPPYRRIAPPEPEVDDTPPELWDGMPEDVELDSDMLAELTSDIILKSLEKDRVLDTTIVPE